MRKEKQRQKILDNLGSIEQKLGIQQVRNSYSCYWRLNKLQPEDWLTINLSEAYEMGLSKKVIKNQLLLVDMLQQRYPSLQWEKMFTMQGRFGQQRRLERAIASLFPVD